MTICATFPSQQKLNQQKYAFFAQLNTYQKTTSIMLQASQFIDETLQQLWQEHALPDSIQLFAIGGYGRQDLAPFSDIDVLILIPSTVNACFEEALKTWINACWDHDLMLSASVRTIEEALSDAQHDRHFQTALLESRCVIGSTEIFQTFQEKFFQQLDRQTFFYAKNLERIKRHRHFQNSAYNLEPNIKESPGGLRDIHHAKWLAIASGFGSHWHDFVRHQLLTEKEAAELERHENFLKYLRIHLHLLTKRKQETLFFDQQMQLGIQLNYHDSKFKRANEKLMRRYYWVAKSINYLTHIMTSNIKTALFSLQHTHTPPNTATFYETQGMLEVANIHLFSQQPQLILEAFLLYATTPSIKEFSITTLRALYAARDKMDLKWREDQQNRSRFIQILQHPHGLTQVLRLMNETHVLGAYLLNFRHIIGQMQHDLYHVYTVDEHILHVVANLKRFSSAEHAHEFSLCSQIMRHFERPWLLYIAGLFHDIAKGRRGDHALLGMIDARKFCLRHNLQQDENDLIVWLVKYHLQMSHVAQKQNIYDPVVIQAFANFVGNQRYLDALYLLTIADIRATSHKVWNSWKAKLLEDLYLATQKFLIDKQEACFTHASHHRKKTALQLLNQTPINSDAQNAVWQQLDIGYFLRHEAEDIAWHTQVLSTISPNHPITVKCRLHQETIQVLVYTKNQPDLFAQIAYFFAKNHFSILDARLNTTKHHYALNQFVIEYNQTTDASFATIATHIEHQLTQHLRILPQFVKPFKSRLSRRGRSLRSNIYIDISPDTTHYYWTLNISAVDHLGLLHGIALVLVQHQIEVHAARINTLGERVEDTFLIRSAHLHDEKHLLKLKTALIQTLENQ